MAPLRAVLAGLLLFVACVVIGHSGRTLVVPEAARPLSVSALDAPALLNDAARGDLVRGVADLVPRPAQVRASRATRPRHVPRPVVGGLRFGWTDDPFAAVSACEAGMNPRRVSRSGKYWGAFQWDLPSWHGLGEVGTPIDYSYEYQRAVAVRMQGARGWRPWPTCARKLGLL